MFWLRFGVICFNFTWERFCQVRINISHVEKSRNKSHGLCSNFRSVTLYQLTQSRVAWNPILSKEQTHTVNIKNSQSSYLHHFGVLFLLQGIASAAVLSFFIFFLITVKCHNSATLTTASTPFHLTSGSSAVLLILIWMTDNIWPCC